MSVFSLPAGSWPSWRPPRLLSRRPPCRPTGSCQRVRGYVFQPLVAPPCFLVLLPRGDDIPTGYEGLAFVFKGLTRADLAEHRCLQELPRSCSDLGLELLGRLMIL